MVRSNVRIVVIAAIFAFPIVSAAEKTAPGKEFGYIKSLSNKSAHWTLLLQTVQCLTGKEAVKAAKEDGVIASDDEGELVEQMYIRKKGSKLQTLVVSPNARVFLLMTDKQGSLPLDDEGKVKHSRIGIEALGELVAKGISAIPNLYANNPDGVAGIIYEVETNNNLVTNIKQVYSP